MNKEILVPLKKHDRVEEIVPYIEKLTQPGMSVVFLIHDPVNGLKWLQAYCAIMECELEKTVAITRMIESYSAKTRRQLAQQRVFHACEALHRLGVKTAVEVYAGSLRRALKSGANDGDAQLVVMKPGLGQRIVSFLQGTLSTRGMFRRPSSSAVMFLHPGT